MKKFMIFLLMTFLYLGTCQARSVAAHPTDASLKLLSWVSPSPAQSFLTRANDAGDFKLTPSGTIYFGVSSNNSKVFTRPSGDALYAIGFQTGEKVATVEWLVDGVTAASGKDKEFTLSGLIVGEHTLICVITTDNGNTFTSDAVNILVSEEDLAVGIVGVNEACEGSNVTLTAVIEAFGFSVTGFQYLWYKDGEAIPGATSQTYSFVAESSDELSHEYSVEVTREGCKNTKAPVHIFTTIEQPTITLTLPEFVCDGEGTSEITAQAISATGAQPTMYKWFSINGSDTASLGVTTENIYFIANQDLIDNDYIGVMAVYANSCNTDTVFTESTINEATTVDHDEISVLVNDAAEDITVCVNTQVVFSVEDDNDGTPTYNWYVNNTLVENQNGDTYTANLKEAGTYNVYVEATYAEDKCASVIKSEAVVVTVETAPAIAITGNNVICANQTTTLYATELGENYTYTWTLPDGTTTTSDDVNLEEATAGVYNVFAENSENGCKTATAEFTVWQFGADLQVVASNYKVCPGESVTLSANANGWTNANINYEWNDDEDLTTSSISVDVDDDGVFTVKAYAVDAEGEAIEGCELTQEISVKVIETEDASLTVSIEDKLVCVGGQVVAEIEDDNADDNQLYNWYMNGVQIPGEHLNEITMNMNEVGAYTFAASRANTVCAAAVPESSDEVQVIAMPSVVITGNNVICQGAEATLTANVIDADDNLYPSDNYPYSYSYFWNGPDSDVDHEADEEVTTTVPGVYAVTVYAGEYDDDLEFLMTGCVAHATFTVYQVGGHVQIIPSATVVCPGEPVVLTANASGFNNQNLAYAWESGEDNSTITVFPSETTTYSVKVFAKAVDDDNEEDFEEKCFVEDAIVITVKDTAAETLTISAEKNEICEGGMIHATVDGSDASLYVWYLNGIEVAGQNLSDIYLNLNTPGEYTLAAKVAGDACTTVAPAEIDEPITVYAHPSVTITGNTTICVGDSALITVTATPDSADYTYTWNPETGVTATAADETVKISKAGVYTVTVEDDNSGCVADADVTIYQLGGELQVSASQYEVCANDMVVLNAHLTGWNNENIKYAWSATNDTEVNDTTSTLVVNPAETDTYVVTAIGGNCTLVDSVTITVKNDATTAALIVEAAEKTFCVGSQVSVAVKDEEGVNANGAFVWYVNGVVLEGENLSEITLNINEPGMYVFAAAPASTSCVISSAEDMDTVMVYANPVVAITGDHFYTVGGTPATLVATEIENATYLWSNGAAESTIDVTEAGVYNVVVTDSNGCVTTSESFKVDAVEDIIVNIVGVESACMNDIVTLTAVVENDLLGSTYQWLVDGEYVVGQTGAQFVFRADTLYANDSLFSYDITVEVAREGCNIVTSPVHKFMIRPVPETYVVAPVAVCENQDVTLEASVYALGDIEIYNYEWFIDDENTPYDTVNYVNTITIPYADAVGHKFAVKANYQDTACAAQISEFVEIELTEKPADIVLNVNTDSLCSGSRVVYTLENVVDSLGANITWVVNGVQVENAHDTLYAAYLENNGMYNVYASVSYDNYPCEVFTSNDTVINYFANPTIQITGDPFICIDSTVNLFAVINDTVVATEYTYDWRLYNYSLDEGSNEPDFSADNAIDITFANDAHLTTTLASQDHPYIFTVKATSESGCVAESAPYYVYVGANPTVAVTVNYDTVCAGGEVVATAHLGDYNMDNIVYQWFANGDSVLYGTSQDLTYVVEDNTTFKVVVTQTTTQCTANGSDSVAVVAPKQIDNIVVINNGEKATNICEGAQLYVTAMFKDEEGNLYVDSTLNYIWEENGFVMPLVNGPSFSKQAYIYDGDPVDYAYTAYVNYGVPGCEAVPVASDTIHVRRNPIVTIDGTPNVCYFNDNDYNITLTAWVDGVQDTTATYRWFESGQERPNTAGYDNKYRASWPVTYLNPWIFTVEVENGNGCTSMSEPFYVNVYDAPEVNITADAAEVCQGGAVTLNANLDNYNDPMLTFQWYQNAVDENNIMPGYTHEQEIVNPTATTNYIVRVTHLMYSGTSGSGQVVNQACWSADTFQVVVNTIPVVSLTNNLPEENVVCDGYQLNLTASVEGGVQGGEVYTWYRNGSVIEGANAAEYSEVMNALNNEPTQYTYSVSVAQSASGCESEVYTMNAFTVNPNPAVELTTDPIVCVEEENNITLVANVYPQPETGVTYKWFEDNTMFTESADNTISLTKPYRDYPYSFSVQLVNQYACVAENSALVYVNAAPVVNITVSESEICEGGEVTLTANLNDWNADQLVYQWMDNDEVINGATSLTYTVAPALGSHEYTLNVSQLTSGCSAISNVQTVNVKPIPVISQIQVSDVNVCVGGQLTLTAVVEGETEGAVYTWYKNGVLMEGATAATIFDSPVLVDNNTQHYVYSAVVTLPAAGCTSNVTSSQIVNVYPNPTVVITGDQHVCETDSIFLIANVDTVGMSAGLLHYTWYESGQIRDNMAYNLGDNQFYAEYWYARTEPYKFVVEVTRDNDASGCVARSQEFNVYVYAQPVVNITASETEICEGGQVTLTANLNDNNATDLVYQWYQVKEQTKSVPTGYNEDGSYSYEDVTTLVRENIPGATSATYTTTLNATTTLGVMILQTPSTCTANDEITIVVNPIPVVESVVVDNQVVCDGAQVTVSATISPADAAGAVYTWYRNGVLIEGANEASFSENVYTTDNHVTVNNYTAIVTLPASGCVSLMSQPATVTVNPAPSTVSISGNNVICENGTTTLTAYSDVEGTFTWSNGSHESSITVPAGVYTVTMTTTEGCEMTSAPFSVEALGTDLIVSASETSICQGEHTTLYVNQDGWAGNVSYAWDAQAGNSTATTVDVTPNVTTTYHVVATVNSTNGTCSMEGTVTIVVNELPAKVDVTASAKQVCEGSQVAFHASGDAASYIWYQNGVEIPGENQANLIVNFNEEGMYVFAAKAVSEEGCVSAIASDPDTVVVNAAPESVVVSGETVICNGGNTTLYANVTPNVNATYTWFKDNVAIINSNNSALVVNAAGSYKVEATVNGCTTVSDAVEVTVEQAPQLQLTATETSICVGGQSIITAEATGWNNSNVVYNWSNGFQGSVYTFNATAEGAHKFIVTASQATSGCVAVDSIVINVNAAPAAPQIVVDNAVICDGGQVKLSVANADNNATYTWFRNGVVINGANQAVIFESPLAVDGDATTYNYSAVATLPASGCVSAISSDAVVTVIPTPVVAVSVNGNTTFCQGGSTELQANVTPAGVGYSYQWYQDNVLIPGANNATYTVAADARETAYNYSVVVTANAGCIVTAEAPAISIVADPVVVASVDNDVVCVGGTATFTANVEGGVANVNGLNGYTYAWYNNLSTTVPVATTATFTTTADQADAYSYWVVVTSPYGCQAQSNVVNYTVVNDPSVTVSVAQGYPTTVCDGGVTTLIANVNGGHGTATYQWYKNGLQLYGETNSTIETQPLTYGDAAAYSVVVSQSGVGCEAVSLPYNVNVAPAYTVNITGFGNVCEGGTLSLTAAVNNVLDGDVLSYQWYKVVNGNNAVAINGANSAQYSTSDLLLGNSYDYYVVVTSSISGCSVVSSSVPANVVAQPTVVINGANSVCENSDLLTLNAQVSGGVEGADYTYTWNWTGAANGSATTATPSYNPVLNASDYSTPYYFTVTVSRNDNTGCVATSEAHEVNVMAVPSVVVTADNNYVCQNGEVTFTANVSPVGTYNYAWTINGQAQAQNASTITSTMSNTGTMSATVVVSAANASASCSSTATIAVPVQVVAAPTVSISANHTSMCVGGTTTLTANVNSNSNVPSDFNYQWAINGIEVEGAVSNTFVQPLNAAGTYVYTLKVSQNNNLGCTSTWSAPVTVQVAEQPVVSLSSADGLAICEGGSVTLTGVVNNYGNNVNGVVNSNVYGAMTYDWNSNGINVHHNTNVSNAQNQVTETLNNVGNYSYQVVVTPSGYNCQPQASNIEVVNVVSNPSWTDVHVYSSNGVDACFGEMVTLSAAIQGGASDYEGSTNGHIQWIVTDENGNVANVTGGLGGNSYDIPSQAGTYVYTPTFVGNIGSGCQLSNTGDVQVAVTVHELPTAVFVNGDGSSLCANDPSASAELVIQFTGVAPFNYQVVDGNGNVVAQALTLANTVSIYVAPGQQTTYRINMVADAFCENTALDANAVATVYVNSVEFEDNFFVSGCDDNGEVTVNFNMISGNPSANFTVTYENGMTANGTISNNSATFAAPSVPGDYNAVFTVDGCSYDIVVRVLVGDYAFGGTLPIMDQRWNDVVVVNNNPATNGGHTFVGFQWYKNGVAIPGATYSNYQDKDGLNGFYSVELIEQDANGNMVSYMTCETYFNSVSSVKVYPVPANVRQEITIELDLTSEELEGAVLDIYSVTGAHISHVSDLQPITKIEGFKAQGTYFGRILTGTNEIKTVKFVIVK